MRWYYGKGLLVSFTLFIGIVDAAERPNFVVIFADDLGYGDLSCQGNRTIKTPRLDQMAGEGIRFTSFYTGESVCTPSRAALLTGRLPIRNGMSSDKRRVLFPDSGGGLPAEEVTLAESLSEAGYVCGCFGKWHLGHLPQFLPTSHGFHSYFGIPYSNDMDRVAGIGPMGRAAFLDPKVEYWNVPLLRNQEVVERPADQTTITRRYTEEAVKFMGENKDRPFFVYLPHNLPHVPLFRSPEFEGRSAGGFYGDVIEEIDWSVGRVLDTLKELGIAENTLVFFTSDNGPWLIFGDHGGTAGPLREGKGCTWEGGMRVPAMAWWPGTIAPDRVSHDPVTTMDLFPTFVHLAGGKLPDDRTLDGMNLTPLLLKGESGPRSTVYFYRGPRLMAIRHGDWKAHFRTQGSYGPDSREETLHDPPLLFNLASDVGETTPVTEGQDEVLQMILQIRDEHLATVQPVLSQLEIPLQAAP